MKLQSQYMYNLAQVTFTTTHPHTHTHMHTHTCTCTHTHAHIRTVVDVVSYSAVNQASEQHNQIEQYHEYDAIEPMSELSTLTNEAYGKIKEGTSAHEEYVDDPGNGPRIITSQNIAYGDISTSTTRYDDSYYVNEGLNDPSSSMIENEAYGDISGQGSSSRVTGSLDNTSIPTTRNEAYTSVSTNTERVDTEETYDYVTNL